MFCIWFQLKPGSSRAVRKGGVVGHREVDLVGKRAERHSTAFAKRRKRDRVASAVTSCTLKTEQCDDNKQGNREAQSRVFGRERLQINIVELFIRVNPTVFAREQ